MKVSLITILVIVYALIFGFIAINLGLEVCIIIITLIVGLYVVVIPFNKFIK